MKIFVTAKTNAKKEGVKRIDSTHFAVSIKESPVDGKANEAIVQALAEHFSTSKSNIHLIFGFTSKKKVIEVGLR